MKPEQRDFACERCSHQLPENAPPVKMEFVAGDAEKAVYRCPKGHEATVSHNFISHRQHLI
jgi:hypothetical protein